MFASAAIAMAHHRIVLQGTRSSRCGALSFRQMQIMMMQSPCRIGNHQPPGMSVKYHAHHVSCLTMSTYASNKCLPVLIDLRSDTLTQPTEKIRQSLVQAQTGDDVYHEDNEVKALETAMAQLLGHEASLFVPSGTMANLLAVMTHCQKRGSEVLLGHKSHMFRWSQGNIAQIAGVHSNALTNMPDGTFCLNELQTRIQADDEHCPITSLICIENTHCDTGGTILNLPWLRELRAMSTKYNIPVHVDGARLLNAAVGLKIPPSELVRGFESVQVCLSKGVGAPFGSILAGTKRFVTQARRYRKAIGGGVRQNGFMARAGLCALEDWEMKLQRDHEHAKLIAQGVESIGSGQVRLLTESVDSNIVLLRTKCVSPEKIVSRLKRITPDEGESLEGSIAVRCAPLEKDVIRLVTSCNQSTEDIKLAVKKLQFVIMELLKM